MATRCLCTGQRAFTTARPSVARPSARPRLAPCQAYIEASATYAITQQALAYAMVLGGDAYLERNSKAAPDLKIAGAGAGAVLVAVGILNTGIDALTSVGMIVGFIASVGMFVYHAKRTAEAEDENADWPGPKALPGTIALISFFALNVFFQGIRAEL